MTRPYRQDFLAGMRDILPILPGMVPFGLLAGATALQAGLAPWQAQTMSLFWLAGASQLAAIDLMAQQAAWPVILLTVLVVNLRFVMYSAVLAPVFAHLPATVRLAMASVVTDQGFALAIGRHRGGMQPTAVAWYFAGNTVLLWLTWQGSTLLGCLVGTVIPPAWQLDFSVPLVFLALLVPLLGDRPSVTTAVVAAVVTVAGRGLPWNLGLVLGVVTGIAAGLLVELRRDSTPEASTP